MKGTAGKVFSLAGENVPAAGCTISTSLSETGHYAISCFSLAAGTDIGSELYEQPKIWLLLEGKAEALAGADPVGLKAGDIFLTPVGKPVGIRSAQGAVYLEIALKGPARVNPVLRPGAAAQISGILPLQPGRIVNLDLVGSPALKFALMSFGAGTGLSEHAAPGDALVFALSGEGVIGYEGERHPIRAGENFKFAAGGRHSVGAPSGFQMALLLELP
ncbi:cupin domain-containing protein [Mesosutterella sp. AGMB02718]|uniref:Cupin domain-containing protein n=1 Tax=Mesosutterella faecium TaxID=2925194 RepID=A0ABT7ILY4_9BURK|nr:cupin domain-containing protein [Mesosutterella sp. AGMB02718]MDL2059367.1 cupin domain-containing protein [Mesosutterella sp. AGMB02718]